MMFLSDEPVGDGVEQHADAEDAARYDREEQHEKVHADHAALSDKTGLSAFGATRSLRG